MSADHSLLTRVGLGVQCLTIAMLLAPSASMLAQNPPRIHPLEVEDVGAAVASSIETPPARYAGGLTIDEAIRTAIVSGVNVRLGRLKVRARAGAHLAASGIFDPRLTTSVTAVRELQPASGVGETPTAAPIQERVSSYHLGLNKVFGSGVRVQPQIDVSHSAANALSPQATALASVSLAATVPLLRDRGGTVTRSSQRTAQALYTAEGHALRHTVSSTVLQAIVAYWQYAAAYEQLAVQRASETRARQLVSETEALVQADERPAADLNHVRGNLVSKRIETITAEQTVVEAKRDLGLTLGLAAAQIGRLPPPVTEFPFAAPPVGERMIERLISLALQRRRDLSAAGSHAQANRVLAEAAENETRPRLDLSLSVGYTGTQIGGGMEGIFQSLYSQVPGLNASLQLEYDIPLANNAARGHALEQAAAYEQARVVERDLARQIAAEVETAFEALRSTAASLDEAARAVELHRITVENERVKHQLGEATLFDVILAEDALTDVLQTEVAARLNHAAAIAALRYQTGTLVEHQAERFAVPPDAPRTVPSTVETRGP